MQIMDEASARWMPSEDWCYWFMANKLDLVRRRVTGHQCNPEEQEVQRRIHEANLRKLALFLSRGGERRYIFGSDEFGLHLFPHYKYKWEKKGAEHVTSDLKVIHWFY